LNINCLLLVSGRVDLLSKMGTDIPANLSPQVLVITTTNPWIVLRAVSGVAVTGIGGFFKGTPAIYADGSVGIGTTSPSGLLDVHSSLQFHLPYSPIHS